MSGRTAVSSEHSITFLIHDGQIAVLNQCDIAIGIGRIPFTRDYELACCVNESIFAILLYTGKATAEKIGKIPFTRDYEFACCVNESPFVILLYTGKAISEGIGIIPLARNNELSCRVNEPPICNPSSQGPARR